METDFGVIYERPPTPTSTQRSMSSSALATSPEGATSGFSQALSLGDDDDADLSMGPGLAPKVQETVRRKSVNAKDKQVVTIGEFCRFPHRAKLTKQTKSGRIGRTS